MTIAADSDIAVRTTFAATVDRNQVHRNAIGEVLLTHCGLGFHPDTFHVGAQWPRAHTLYAPTDGCFNTLLMAETLRQTAIYLAHSMYDVPLSYRFVMQDLAVAAAVEALHVGLTAGDVEVFTVLSQCNFRSGTLAGFRIDVEFRMHGEVVGSGGGTATVFTPGAYDAVRWRDGKPATTTTCRIDEPISPATVGEIYSHNVVLARGESKADWLLRIDETHPILFDHPCDHVPGMLIIQAIAQATRVATGEPTAPLSEISTKFLRFGEKAQPVGVHIRPPGNSTNSVSVEFLQSGQLIASGHARIRQS